MGVWWACQQPYPTQAETIWVVSGIADQLTIGTTSGGNWRVAYPLQIRWRASDTSLFYLAAVSATATTATTATTMPSALTAGDANTMVVVLAVALAVAILLGIAAILVYRRHYRRRVREALGLGLRTDRGEAAGLGMTEMPDTSLDKVLPLTTTDFRDSLVLLTLGICVAESIFGHRGATSGSGCGAYRWE